MTEDVLKLDDDRVYIKRTIKTTPGEILFIEMDGRQVGVIRAIDQDGVVGLQVVFVKEKI